MKKFDSKIEKHRIKRGPQGSSPELGRHGCFMLKPREGVRLFCIVTDGGETKWEHISVHAQYQNRKKKVVQRIPTWEEMSYVKRMFWKGDEVVMQLHPKEEDYVDDCKYCLHLWKPSDMEIPTPPKEFV